MRHRLKKNPGFWVERCFRLHATRWSQRAPPVSVGEVGGVEGKKKSRWLASSLSLPPQNSSSTGTSGPLRTRPPPPPPLPQRWLQIATFPLFSARQSRVCRKNKSRVCVQISLVSKAQRAAIWRRVTKDCIYVYLCVSTRGQPDCSGQAQRAHLRGWRDDDKKSVERKSRRFCQHSLRCAFRPLDAA